MLCCICVRLGWGGAVQSMLAVSSGQRTSDMCCRVLGGGHSHSEMLHGMHLSDLYHVCLHQFTRLEGSMLCAKLLSVRCQATEACLDCTVMSTVQHMKHVKPASTCASRQLVNIASAPVLTCTAKGMCGPFSDRCNLVCQMSLCSLHVRRQFTWFAPSHRHWECMFCTAGCSSGHLLHMANRPFGGGLQFHIPYC